MEDELTSCHGFLQGFGIAQVSDDAICFQIGDVLRSAGRAHEHAKVSALRAQKLRNMAADKSGGSGNEDFHFDNARFISENQLDQYDQW